jgi:2-amino-4-hydroxy-6-hydroxymethyldihydropteridine diphosphokinase
MTRYAVALGSNQGDRMEHLRRAVDELSGVGTIEALSPLYETAPIGGPDQDSYLNAVVIVATDIAPEDLLTALQEIEAGHNRLRTVRWGPRTLDLDIVTSDGPATDTPTLQMPHPRATERLFVLQPLCDVWPDAPLGNGLTALEGRKDVADQEVKLVATTWAKPPSDD